jgi:hypothetical protein
MLAVLACACGPLVLKTGVCCFLLGAGAGVAFMWKAWS